MKTSRRFILATAIGVLLPLSFASAEPQQYTTLPEAVSEEVEGGTLNPEELTLRSRLELARQGKVNFVTCAQGYLVTKKGAHKEAREIFEECAEQGYTQAMTWMAYMAQNGFGIEQSYDAATDWDARAADGGDEVGKFNYGLDLLMGRGTEKDPEKGKELIDEAAEAGLKAAIWLQNADYRVEEVIPDPDEHTIPRDGAGF